MIRIVVADDREVIRHHVRRVLISTCDLVGEAADGRALLELVPRVDPDVVVMDISMPHVSGIEATRRLTATGGRARVVLLTIHESPEYVREGLACGALGYVVKSRMALDLSEAVAAATRGQRFISPTSALDGLLEPRSDPLQA